MATRTTWKSRGVLNGTALRRDSPPGRYLPEPPLDGFVEHFWTVAWNLDAPIVRETLPHPSVHLIVEAGRSGLTGPFTRRFTRRLEGRGRVLGIKFLPGGFRPFWKRSISSLANRVLPLGEAFGRAGETFETDILACGDDEPALLARAEQFLLARLPPPDAQAQLARSLVARIRADPTLLRTETLADQAGLSVRALQRLFSGYVGVSPKWVIQRYRLHEAMERLESGAARDLPALAQELGYFDQAHFSRAFKALLGRSPGSYARESK
ncbi:MAG: AraC family transcriptional regulator [Deltaproteobacteria bacterium]|nr:AraC family transcriptional regulator [Deltaproteobacteria bacterium]